MPKYSQIRNSGIQTQDLRDTSISERYLFAQQPQHCNSAHAMKQAQETSSAYPIKNITSQPKELREHLFSTGQGLRNSIFPQSPPQLDNFLSEEGEAKLTGQMGKVMFKTFSVFLQGKGHEMHFSGG